MSGRLRRFQAAIHLVDSATIELLAHCLPWAKHRRRKAAAKAHVRLDFHSLLPGYVVFDRAYVDLKGLDGRTTRRLGYQTSQKLRKRIEEVFGWCKEIEGLRRTRRRGTDRIGLSTILILTTYNLVRMRNLLGSQPVNGPATA